MKQLVGRSALASCTMNSQQFGALYKFSSILPVSQHNLQWGFFFFLVLHIEQRKVASKEFSVILNVQSLDIVSKSPGVF